jgi:hypothetical protein
MKSVEKIIKNPSSLIALFYLARGINKRCFRAANGWVNDKIFFG